MKERRVWALGVVHVVDNVRQARLETRCRVSLTVGETTIQATARLVSCLACLAVERPS